MTSQPAISPGPIQEMVLAECLNRCLAALAAPSRELILDYYASEGRKRIDARKRMAEALGISESALRNRAQRLRDGLERCITCCLRPAERPGPPSGNDTNA